MAINFDVGKVRSITSGEVNGSVRMFILVICACVAWGGAIWFSGRAKSAMSSLSLQQSRYYSLSQLAAEYKGMSTSAPVAGNIDVMTVFTQVSARIGLGTRVTRITPTPDGKRCSVEMARLYAEEATDVIRELAARGVRVSSAEIRALPAGEERLFTMTAFFEAGS